MLGRVAVGPLPPPNPPFKDNSRINALRKIAASGLREFVDEAIDESPRLSALSRRRVRVSICSTRWQFLFQGSGQTFLPPASPAPSTSIATLFFAVCYSLGEAKMVHPATQRTAMAAISAMCAPVDIGFIFPPRPGEERGRGVWTYRDLVPADVAAVLPRAAATNANGAAIYMRLGPSTKDHHPGIILLDDLDREKLARLSNNGFEPCLLIQTSPHNFQAWIKLVAADTVSYRSAHAAIRTLAIRYGSDPRAVSPLRPRRLPGFTNRKPKHRIDGRYPFVKLISADPSIVASAGQAFIARVDASQLAQARLAGGAAPETPPKSAAKTMIATDEIFDLLNAIHGVERQRVMAEVQRCTRPPVAASNSEIDFATAAHAILDDVDPAKDEIWLSCNRPDKSGDYPERTVKAAQEYREDNLHARVLVSGITVIAVSTAHNPTAE